jgi:hypothetical protein
MLKLKKISSALFLPPSVLKSTNRLNDIDPSRIENEIVLETINLDLCVEVHLLEVKLRSVKDHPVSCIYSGEINFDRHNQQKGGIVERDYVQLANLVPAFASIR